MSWPQKLRKPATSQGWCTINPKDSPQHPRCSGQATASVKSPHQKLASEDKHNKIRCTESNQIKHKQPKKYHSVKWWTPHSISNPKICHVNRSWQEFWRTREHKSNVCVSLPWSVVYYLKHPSVKLWPIWMTSDFTSSLLIICIFLWCAILYSYNFSSSW